MGVSRFHIKPGAELRSYSLHVADLMLAFVEDYTYFFVFILNLIFCYDVL